MSDTKLPPAGTDAPSGAAPAPPTPTAAPGAGKPIGPPSVVLLLALVCVAGSLGLLFVGGLAANILGYALASVLPILCVGWFRHLDLNRRISPFYVPHDTMARLIPLMLVLGLLAAVLHTWSIATEIAS